MPKETLTLDGIVHDLARLAKWQPTDRLAYRSASSLIGVVATVLAAVYLQYWWIAAIVALFPLYHILRGVLEWRVARAKIRAVRAIRDCGDISIATVK